MGIIELVTTTYHDYPSNFSNGNMSVNGIGDLFLWLNDSMGGVFSGGLLACIAIIAFMTLKGFGFPASKSLATSCFVTTLISVTLMMAGIVAFYVVMIFAVITVLATLAVRSEANIGL